jgi:ribulose-5-phosphate 4-epimerase/fuculose-1-phosphate aldolase
MSPAAVAMKTQSVRSQCSPEEWKARQDLACAYRLFDHFGWHGLIFNHITLRVPGTESTFLINPYGLMYREVTASNLVKIDVDGNIIGDSDYPVNRAGFVIHSALHMARPDAHAIMHTHTNEGVAVGAQEHGLLPLSMGAIGLQGAIAYHEFEGISLDTGERERLIADLGNKNVLILRNHGLLTCGGTIAEAFMRMRTLQGACEMQVMALAGGTKLHYPAPETLKVTADQVNEINRKGGSVHGRKPKEGESSSAHDLMWAAMTRWMTDKDPTFLN